ncbi:NSFL1 cofactor p47 [Drosophila grimshawi]|uniref:GH20600 n=1 Tax=Drosophila grimshawi TaxID=7222 RepID=B4J7W1_DROGR|nr:NSFL1 cofactor p47 [Drosophila grimshawi]EDW01167.1 GH20600 [Drosophila grimshawi]
MAARGDLVAQFIEITGTDETTAKFYLNSSDWDIEQSLGNYWTTQSDLPVADPTAGGQSNNPTPATTSTGAGAFGAAAPETKAVPASSSVPPKASAAKPKFATLSDMSTQSSSDDEHQAFYAGGSDRSGQQVLGPAKKKNFREQLTDMMRSAQEQNIAEVGAGPSTSGTGNPSGGSVWGQGMRLGMTDNDHTAVGTNRTAQLSENKPVVVLKLWSQGFSIDGGELRHYDDPQNKEFLETVMRGEIPQELLEMGRMVNVDVEDHRHEDFKRQAAPQTFKGSGQKLGSPVANVVTNTPSDATAAAAVAPEDVAKQEASARDALNLNAGAPLTTVQIRLADGSRLAAQFNLTHTVSDIRRFIQTARPQYSNSNFVLVSSFPTRELSDDSSTIEKAGLKNAALMQRLK